MNKRQAKAVCYIVAAEELNTALNFGIAETIAMSEGGTEKDIRRIEDAMGEIIESLCRRGERMS